MKHTILALTILLTQMLINCSEKELTEITQNIEDDSTNILRNGRFDFGESNWELIRSSGAVAGWEVIDEKAQIIIANTGDFNYNLQFVQQEVSIKKNTSYKISLEAFASSARSVSIAIIDNERPNSSYFSHIVEISTELQHYDLTFTHTGSIDFTANFVIVLGQNKAAFTVDNIHLQEIEYESIDNLEISQYSTGTRQEDFQTEHAFDQSTVAELDGYGDWLNLRLDNYGYCQNLTLIIEHAESIVAFEVLSSPNGINYTSVGTYQTNGLTTGIESFSLSPISRVHSIKIVNLNGTDEKIRIQQVVVWGENTNTKTLNLDFPPDINEGLDTNWNEVSFEKRYHTPYNKPLEERYSVEEGIEYLWIYTDDVGFEEGTNTNPRSEVRIINQDYTTGSHQISFDMMIPSGTTGCSVFQIFGGGDNGGATSLMLHVYDGNLYKYTSGLLLENFYNNWHQYIVQHYANTGEIRIYIDGNLAMVTEDRGNDTHYFKYGVYKQWIDPSEKMEAYFNNVQLFMK